MLNKLVLTFTTAGMLIAVAAAGSYKINVIEDTTVEGKQLKAGDYKVEVGNNTATLKHGKETITVPAHTEQAASKFPGTKIRYVDNSIREINIGGTTTRIVFSGENGTNAGGSE